MALGLMNCPELVKRVSDGLVSERKHPDFLWIYNYTPKTQYSGAWDEYTLNARGLILDRDGNIHSKPFPVTIPLKLPPIPNEPYLITNKLDGSLGISYFIDGEMFLATRGVLFIRPSPRRNRHSPRTVPTTRIRVRSTLHVPV